MKKTHEPTASELEEKIINLPYFRMNLNEMSEFQELIKMFKEQLIRECKEDSLNVNSYTYLEEERKCNNCGQHITVWKNHPIKGFIKYTKTTPNEDQSEPIYPWSNIR